MDTNTNRLHFSGSSLKIIALITMALDHFAAVVIYFAILLPAMPLSPDSDAWIWYQIYQFMRFVGRIAFPIYCFLLVEGFQHTSNRKKYLLRLFLFSLISEIPFDLAFKEKFFDPTYQNVFFTLAIGFVVIWILENIENKKMNYFLYLLVIVVGCVAAEILETDYGANGIILIVVLYVLRYNHKWRTIFGCVSLLWEPAACLAFIPIHYYDGTRGRSLKYFFYLFYPVHLLIFVMIRNII